MKAFVIPSGYMVIIMNPDEEQLDTIFIEDMDLSKPLTVWQLAEDIVQAVKIDAKKRNRK